MNLKARFSLIGLGIVLFLVATPILVLYARGFKYDFRTGQVTKTGALVVKSDPTKANVFLDGKEAGETPVNVRFLLPKDYEIRIEKEGYQPWVKRLSVNSQFVTWANAYREFVTLFYTEPELKREFKSGQFIFSKNGSEIAFTEEGVYKLLNTQNGDVAILGNAAKLSFPEIGGKEVVWQNGSKIYEMLMQKPSAPLSNELLKNLTFAEADGERLILLSAQGDLYSYNFSKLTLLDKNVAAATLAHDGIYYVQKNSLKHLNSGQSDPTIVSDKLPAFKTVSVNRFENKIFLILDQTLYVINDALEMIHSPASFMRWDGNSHQLLFGNQNELQVYNPTSKNTELILRAIKPISLAKFSAEAGYTFYLQDNKIKAIEMDGRDHRNIYTIVENTGTNPNFEISPSGKYLYLFNAEGGKAYKIR